MFYAGLAQNRNVLSVFMNCFGITAIITRLTRLWGNCRNSATTCKAGNVPLYQTVLERRTYLLSTAYRTVKTHTCCGVYGLLLLLCTASTSLADPFFDGQPHWAVPLDSSFQNPLDSLLETLVSKEGHRDPALSLLLAAAPPLLSVQGLGQIYNGDVGKGLFFFGIGQVSIGTWSTAVDQRTVHIAQVVYIASWIWSTIDAYRSAKRINRQRGHDAERAHWSHHAPSFAPPINRLLAPRSNRAGRAQSAHIAPY